MEIWGSGEVEIGHDTLDYRMYNGNGVMECPEGAAARKHGVLIDNSNMKLCRLCFQS